MQSKNKVTHTGDKKKKPYIRSIYDRHTKVKTKDYGKSRTQQHFTEATQVNNIIQKHTSNGIEQDGNIGTRKATFGNYTGVDFREMQTKLAQANETFDALPGKIRKRFDHDVSKLIEFVQDDNNLEEAKTLGFLKEPEKEEPPIEVRIQKDPFQTPDAPKELGQPSEPKAQ